MLVPLLLLPLSAAAAPAISLQKAVNHAMRGQAGAAVVMAVDSGRIVAHYHLETARRRLVRPGSTLKPLVLAALLDLGKLRGDEFIFCPRQLRLLGRQLDCSHVEIPGPVDAVSALAYSCNCFFAEFATRLPVQELCGYLRKLGLTSAYASQAPDPEQPRLLALGESNMLVSPLAVLAAYRKLAILRRQAEKSARLIPVFAGLEACADFGTGRLAKPPGVEIAGKTGTSTASEGRWTHAWFAGYAPAAAPEIVLVVFLERGRGSGDAAPIASEILRVYQGPAEKP